TSKQGGTASNTPTVVTHSVPRMNGRKPNSPLLGRQVSPSRRSLKLYELRMGYERTTSAAATMMMSATGTSVMIKKVRCAARSVRARDDVEGRLSRPSVLIWVNSISLIVLILQETQL